MIDLVRMESLLSGYGLPSDPALCENLDRYGALLWEWNQKMNLTAITDPEGIAVKHFLDSLLFLKVYTPKEGSRLIDVGTGAGFPGVPLALARRDLSVTLLDSLNKRLLFLDAVAKELSLSVERVHGRAEELGRKEEYREQYDCATARAVAHLRELSEYCLPFVRVGGVFVALKGPDMETELSESRYAIEQMGGEVESVTEFSLPEGSKRTLLVLRKNRPTPTKYPRNAGKIKKEPLIRR